MSDIPCITMEIMNSPVNVAPKLFRAECESYLQAEGSLRGYLRGTCVTAERSLQSERPPPPHTHTKHQHSAPQRVEFDDRRDFDSILKPFEGHSKTKMSRPGSSAARNLTLTEELERLEQSITLTLQGS